MSRWMQRIARRIRALMDRERLDRDVDAEMRLHLEMEAEELMRVRGLSHDEAHRLARISFGGVERYKEEHRDARGVRWASELGQDLRDALRALRASPAFTGAAVVSLALALGANTALFSIVKTVLLEPLPFADPERVVTISEHPWTPAEIVLELRRTSRSLERIAAYAPERYAITGGGEPRELEGARATTDFFRLLGARIAIGRDFVASDAKPGAARTAIISHDLWLQQFGGDSGVVGRTVRVDDVPCEIIGVTSAGFRLLAPRSDGPRIWLPFAVASDESGSEGNWVIPVARLAPHATLRDAQAELDAVTRRYEIEHASADGPREWRLRLATVKSELVGGSRPALLVLQLAVGVLLLLSCVNVANLLLARSSARAKEAAVRSALGASHARLVRRLLTESTLLALLGGIAGLIVLRIGLDVLLSMAPANTPRIGDVTIDWTVLLFALAVSVATGLFFGVLPAVLTARHATFDLLKEGGRTPTRSRRHNRLSQLLVGAQVALTLVLLVGAGLLARTFVSLASRSPGFRTSGITTVRLHVPLSRYTSVASLNGFYERVLERVRSVPGVASVALANNLPISRGNSTREYDVEGRGAGTGVAQYGVVNEDYFRTLGIALIEGRVFQPSDRPGAPGVAIIDESMRRAVWPGESALGKRFRFEDDWLTVVGVVADTRGSGLASDPLPGFYIPYRQRPATDTELAVGHDAVLLVATSDGVTATSRSLRDAIRDVDARQPVPEVSALDDVIADGVSPERFRAILLGAFAVIAMVLVVTGTYGVVSYLVAERTHEFAIRMVMGATARDIIASVVRRGVLLAACGVAAGLLLVTLTSRYLAGMLFGIGATDPLTLAGAVAIVTVVTLIACLVPASSVGRVDPSVALRSDPVVRWREG